MATSKAKAKAKKEVALTEDGQVIPVETQEPVAVVAAAQLEKWIQDIKINSSLLLSRVV